jgi:hypothetical protein
METPDVRWDFQPAEDETVDDGYVLVVDGNETPWGIQCGADGFHVGESLFDTGGELEAIQPHGCYPTLDAAKVRVAEILESMAFDLAECGDTPVPWLEANAINERLYRHVLN